MRGLLTCLGVFSVVPVSATPDLSADRARSALRWLPLVGAVLGGVAALPAAAVRHWAPHATAVGAVVAVAILIGLTRALHLDGLADTADGLGSRAPAERAQAIMRQSDIGPFGVVAVGLVLAANIAALASVPHGAWAPVAALAVAAATGRLAALHASAAAPAHPDGFGRLVAGAGRPVAAAPETIAVLAGGALAALLVAADWWWWVGAQVVALAVGYGLRIHTSRRLGGTTGDVFGALIELVTALVLAVLALR